MVKHQAERDISPYSKRQKLSRTSSESKVNESPAAIGSWRDLQQLLAFSQDATPQLRQNVQRFKAFLDSVAYGDEPEIQVTRRKILLEYLQSQSVDQQEGSQLYLPELIRSWSFATQSNNENLFSAIAAVLALFLKTVSGSLEFREFGNQLCQTLLEDDQLKLLDRGLSANRVKEHVVSPYLRLLTEIVSFDGGTAAKLVWRCRETTFKHLEVFLGMRKDNPDNLRMEKRKPSIRDNALRYLLANLRLQDPVAKAGILSLAQGKVARSIFQDLKQDFPSILIELLNVFKKDVLSDKELPKHIKKALFKEGTLSRIASLYNYDAADEPLNKSPSVQQTTHSLLLLVCTSPEAGILESPKEYRRRRDMFVLGSRTDDGALIEGIQPAIHAKQAATQNNTIASFLQGLRPWANLLEKDLTIETFQAAPELLADYFQKKSSFTYEPKLSATWIGYTMFLMSAMRLPIPGAYLNQIYRSRTAAADPVSAIIECILPSPLSKRSLTKCLNQSVGLIAFCALKVMMIAFEKLQALQNKLQVLEKEAQGSNKRAMSLQLTAAFIARCPELRHVIAGFRSCPKDHALQRQAYVRLLSLYYSVTPQIALQEKFDISAPLSEALIDYSSSILTKSGMRTLEIEDLLQIAKQSPDMRWWHKPGISHWNADTWYSAYTSSWHGAFAVCYGVENLCGKWGVGTGRFFKGIVTIRSGK